jgi:exodeoxyribonuclease-3
MRQRNIGWRLDYVLASHTLSEHALTCSIAREFGSSDHAPVTATFDVEPPQPDSGVGGGSSPPPARSQLSLF